MLCLVALLLAGGWAPAGAVPPVPGSVLRTLSPAERDLFYNEPFGVDPPLQLRESITARIEAGQTVHLNMVVILGDFADRPANRAVYTPAHYDSLLFSHGVHPTGSMADYYAENSGGRLQLDGRVLGWYRMPLRYEMYVSGVAGRGTYPFNSQGLVEDAVRAADPDINYAVYDNNGSDGVPDTGDDDTVIDLLMVIHAGPGGESGASATNLQSIAFQLPNPTQFDGVFANTFAITPENANLGVYAHETGHLLGLPDLYDLTGGSFGLGTWSLMAGGWSLDEARTPAHLDAWCKNVLHFSPGINVQGTRVDEAIDPVETGGGIYRLWTNGQVGPEYFLVENRRRIGFDRFLPADGLLIYHVNEQRSTNNVPFQYRVALEQADGLFQLENAGHGPSFGDPGDPWTPDSPTEGFGRFTAPGSRTTDGFETGVTVYHIRGPLTGGRMLADLRTSVGPTIALDGIDLPAVDGNGDNLITTGEMFEIRPRLNITSGTAHDVRLELASPDPLATLESRSLSLGDLPPGLRVSPGGFRVRVGAGAPRNPYGMNFQLKISYRDEVALRRSLTVAIGDSVGFADAFEEGINNWTHEPVRQGYYDLWRLELSGGNPATPGGRVRAWHCGNPTVGFPGGTDAALTSPLFILPPAPRLMFDQLVDIPFGDSSQVVAGGFVEASLNGSDWQIITPTGGYDRVYFGRDETLNLTPVFTGRHGTPPVWQRTDFDLASFVGGTRIRFHFFALAPIFIGRGWWIDNLAIVNGETPLKLTALTAAREPDGVRLAWRLAGEDRPVGYNVWRSAADDGLDARINGSLLPAGAVEFVDAHPLAAAAIYRLEAVERDGTTTYLGTLAVEGAGTTVLPPPRLACAPNPAPGATRLTLQFPASGRARLALYDTRGRLVRTLLDGDAAAGELALEWDGRDDAGAPVPAGVYLARLAGPGGAQSRKVVMAR